MNIPIPFLIVGGIILLIAFYLWFSYNSLITLRERIREALSSIDVQLKRRIDLIPNLIESVKGYAKHEKDVLTQVTDARVSLTKAKGPAEKAAANNMLTDALKTLFAVSEAYPDLKASANFIQLQEELSDTEDKIAYSRQFYNSNVLAYNTSIQQFPTMIIAKMFHFKMEEFFEADPGERETPKVKF